MMGQEVGITGEAPVRTAADVLPQSLPAAPAASFIESNGVRSFASKLRGCPAEPE
jgi:hypothetical protein